MFLAFSSCFHYPGERTTRSVKPSENADTLQNDTDDELSSDVKGSLKITIWHLFNPVDETTKKLKKASTTERNVN